MGYELSDLPVQLYVYPGLNVTIMIFLGETEYLHINKRTIWHDIYIQRIGDEFFLENFSLFKSYRRKRVLWPIGGTPNDINRPVPMEFSFGCHPLGPIPAVVDSCVDGCPRYQLSEVWFPISHSKGKLSIWSENIPYVIVDFGNGFHNITGTSANSSLDITTAWHEGEYCLSTQGFKECSRGATSLRMSNNSPNKTLFQFKCEDISCECHHQRLYSLGFKETQLPARFFWRPGPKVDYLWVSDSSYYGKNLSDKISLNSQSWYDVEVTKGVLWDEIYEISIKSLRLRQNFDMSYTRGVVFYSRNENNEKEPSDFAFGCASPPTEESLEIPEDMPVPQSPGTRVLIVLAPLLLIIVIVGLTVWLWRRRRRVIQSPEASHHHPQLPLPLLPPPPVPCSFEEGEDEGEYCEIDEEALRMQLARERMGRTLLACSNQSGKEEDENDKKDKGQEENKDIKNLEAYKETIAQETIIAEWSNPDYEPFNPHEEGALAELKEETQTNGKDGRNDKEDGEEKKRDEKDTEENVKMDVKNIESYWETIAEATYLTEWINPDYEPFTPQIKRVDGEGEQAGRNTDEEEEKKQTNWQEENEEGKDEDEKINHGKNGDEEKKERKDKEEEKKNEEDGEDNEK